MKERNLTINLFSALALCLFCACSSSDDPSPVVPDGPALKSKGIGMSKNETLVYDGREIMNDTVAFETDQWTLTNAFFNVDEVAYVLDFDGARPFKTDCAWLHIEYSDGQMVLSSDPDNLYTTGTAQDFRMAFLTFESKDTLEILQCKQMAELPMGGRPTAAELSPDSIVFPKAGGSFVCVSTNIDASSDASPMHKAWMPYSVNVDETTYQIIDFDTLLSMAQNDYYVDHDLDFNFAEKWLTLRRDNDSPRELHITVAPNETGVERKFRFSYGELVWFYPGILEVVGVQLAE